MSGCSSRALRLVGVAGRRTPLLDILVVRVQRICEIYVGAVGYAGKELAE